MNRNGGISVHRHQKMRYFGALIQALEPRHLLSDLTIAPISDFTAVVGHLISSHGDFNATYDVTVDAASQIELDHVNVSGTLTINGRLALQPSFAGPGINILDGLTFGSNGRIDIANNFLRIQSDSNHVNSVIQQVWAAIRSGYNGGTWDGPGIVSSLAPLDANSAVGVAPDPFSPNVVIVGFTRKGDANLDGIVDSQDSSGTSNTWWEGDFNYDATWDSADVAIYTAHKGMQNLNMLLNDLTPHDSPSYLATFEDPDNASNANDFDVTINWNDGAQTKGLVVALGGGNYGIIADHAYTYYSAYFTPTIDIVDTVDSRSVSSDNFNINMRGAPTAPGSATVGGATSFSVNLQWNSSTPSNSIAEYRIYRGKDFIGATTGTQFTDSSISPNSQVIYRIVAHDILGSDSVPAVVVTSSLPYAPANVEAEPVLNLSNGEKRVKLKWAPVLGAQSYKIYYGTASEQEGTTPDATIVDETAYLGPALTAATRYYKVTAVGETGESFPSFEVSSNFDAGATLLTPTNVTAVQDWESPGNITYSLANLSWSDPNSAGAVAQFEIQVSPDGTAAWTQFAISSDTSQSFRTEERKYYRVRAMNGAAYSNWSAAFTYIDELPLKLSSAISAAPTPIINLQWKSDRSIMFFNIYRRQVGDAEWGLPVKVLPGTVEQWADEDVEVEANYEYAIVGTYQTNASQSNQNTALLASGVSVSNAFSDMEDRGSIALIVDNRFTDSLSEEISRLIRDLEGDGWNVLRHDVEPGDVPIVDGTYSHLPSGYPSSTIATINGPFGNATKVVLTWNDTSQKFACQNGSLTITQSSGITWVAQWNDGHNVVSANFEWTGTGRAQQLTQWIDSGSNPASGYAGVFPALTAHETIHGLIATDYGNHSDLSGVLLLGHIPVPYSGNSTYDGHDVQLDFENSNHKGAFPADVYYGDMDGTWSDAIVDAPDQFSPHLEYLRKPNIPGDGRFDQIEIPGNGAEFQVGRVDMFGLPNFYSSAIDPQSETELLRRYLNKDHAYRQGLMQVDRTGVVIGFRAHHASFESIVGIGNVARSAFTEWFSAAQGANVLFEFGGGGGEAIGMIGGWPSTPRMGSEGRGSPAVFNGVDGSWFGDWSLTDNLMSAILASNGPSLTVALNQLPPPYHLMSMGATIGEATRADQNEPEYLLTSLWHPIWKSLLGDPTLRMDILHPAENLLAGEYGSGVALSWSESPDASQTGFQGYYVYRREGSSGPFTRISGSNPITGLSFNDTSGTWGTHVYMVRAVTLEGADTSVYHSGTYINLSQGVFATTGAENSAQSEQNSNTGGGWFSTASEGYFLPNYGSSIPSNVTVSINSYSLSNLGQPVLGTPDISDDGYTSDYRGPWEPGNYGQSVSVNWHADALLIDVDYDDTDPHLVSLYAADLFISHGSQTVVVLDGDTGETRSVVSFGDFSQGTYMAWSVTGHVKFLMLGADQAFLSAILFG